MKRSAPPEVLDVRQAASRLGRSAETIRRWVWSGRLRAHKSGRKLLIDKSDLDALSAHGSGPALTLAEWYRAFIEERPRSKHAGRSAADLVLADRRRHHGDDVAHARR